MADEKKVSIEDQLGKMEAIIERLKNENLPLEEAMKLYEEGLGIANCCTDEINSVQAKIKIIEDEKGVPEK